LRLAPWFEREFEQTREAALKSLRSERKPLVVVSTASLRGRSAASGKTIRRTIAESKIPRRRRQLYS
jgi:hypothetical protein